MQEMAAPELFVARLVDRATQRGDAAQIALRLRQRAPEHPSTVVLVDRLLRASMAEKSRH